MRRRLVILVLLLLAAGGAYAWVASRPAPPAPLPDFINPRGGYSFAIPAGWRVAVNKYAPDSALFGPDASATEGLGGVEVFPRQDSIEKFLAVLPASASSKTSITVDGNPALEVVWATMIEGKSVAILKGGTIYNLYVNSTSSEDLANFDRIISSFRFEK